MRKVIIIIGMPGSGKSTYYQNILKNEIPDDCFFDDYHESSCDFDTSKHYVKLKNKLSKDFSCAISDIEYCNQNRLDLAVEGIKKIEEELGVSIKIEYIYFENNPKLCKINIIMRNREWYIEELKKVDILTQVYKYPNDVKPIPI